MSRRSRRKNNSPAKNKKRKPLLLIGLAVLLLAPVAIAILLPMYFTKERLVSIVEENLNCRIELEDIEVSAFRYPTRIELKGFALAPRDQFANDATPLGDRPALESAVFRADQVTVLADPIALLQRRIELSSLIVRSAELDFVMDENGDDNLLPLFDSPDGEEKDETEKIKAPVLEVADFEWGVGIREFEIHGLDATARFLGAEITTHLTGLSAIATEIELDPRKLADANRATLTLSGEINVESTDNKPVHYGRIVLDGQADARIFNPDTTELEPDATCTLKLDQSSYLSTQIPSVLKAWDLFQELKVIGIKIDDLPKKATFTNHTLKVRYSDDRVELNTDAGLDLGGWQAALQPGSHYALPESTHLINAKLRTRPSHGQAVDEAVASWIQKAPSIVRPALQEEIRKEWMEDGRITLRLHSQGKLNKPDVSLENKLPDVGKLLEHAKDGALDKLKGLFD